MKKISYLWIAASAITAIVCIGGVRRSADRVDFNTQIKPLINKHCIICHGGVKKNSGFSLLFREDALAKNKSGKPAIIPGDAGGSELMRRLKEHDPEERMPYKKEPLPQNEIDLFSRWIDQGAKWGVHWAYQPLQPVEIPRDNIWNRFLSSIGLKAKPWGRNDVDAFVKQTLNLEKLSPSPEADKAILLRRISLDLTGLPPSPQALQKFLADQRPDAYEKTVDALLDSPRYGERWASWWLDLARYADTKGYERDGKREIWKYRDYVIRSFNEDKPFDLFTTEQLAGDLLPNPSSEQWIATAFHRNTMTNDEGGTDNEEFRTAALLDRVNTTFDVWQSTTFSCIQCHSHPYDPFRHEDYYKMAAFFNNTRDEDTYDDYPYLKEYGALDSAKVENVKAWIDRYADATQAKALKQFLYIQQPARYGIDCDSFSNAELSDTKWLGMRNHGFARLKNVPLNGKTQLVFRYTSKNSGTVWTVRKDRPGGEILFSIPLDTSPNWKIASLTVPAVAGSHDLFLQCEVPRFKGKPNDGVAMFDWLAFINPLPGEKAHGYADVQKDFMGLLNARAKTVTPVMMENPPGFERETHVFERGAWLSKGALVTPQTPRSLNPWPAGAPVDRLGLAQWLVDDKNPLTARTVVNRIWDQLFGAGLVKTLEDFGSQGAAPTHRELLDFLAYRLMKNDRWSLKKLLKEIVLSATYRQQSKATASLTARDPANQFLARGPRVRLSAEQMRDQALAVSGLLSDKMYGPPVMPYQPKGIWTSPYNDAVWSLSKGEDQYRRAVYTFWKRTAPYPSMMTYDGGSREVCQIQRVRTNTPLQALVALNDSDYVDAARSLARRMDAAGASPTEKIAAGYRLALGREIPPATLNVAERLYNDALADFRSRPKEAVKLAAPDHKKPDIEPIKLAALTTVANTFLNVDEMVMKE